MLSTLHTNDAVSTIVRLTNMGVPNFMIASALTLIVAQRLARMTCQNCLTDDDQATESGLLKIGFQKEEIGTFKPKKGSGCNECGQSGYKGRQGIYEVLAKSTELESAILRDARADELLAVSKKNGFRTMQEIGRNFIKKGILDIHEYSRILVI